jgi:hypothetical protein
MSLLKKKSSTRGQPKVYVSKMGHGTSTSYAKKMKAVERSKGVNQKIPFRTRFFKVIRRDLKALCFWRRNVDVLSIQLEDH